MNGLYSVHRKQSSDVCNLKISGGTDTKLLLKKLVSDQLSIQYLRIMA